MNDNRKFIDFKTLKELIGVSHEKRIANVYMDKDKDQIVIETTPGTRFSDATFAQDIIEDGKIIKRFFNAKEANKFTQEELRKSNGRSIPKD